MEKRYVAGFRKHAEESKMKGRWASVGHQVGRPLFGILKTGIRVLAILLLCGAARLHAQLELIGPDHARVNDMRVSDDGEILIATWTDNQSNVYRGVPKQWSLVTTSSKVVFRYYKWFNTHYIVELKGYGVDGIVKRSLDQGLSFTTLTQTAEHIVYGHL